MAALCVWRLVTGSPPARRILLPVAVPAVLFAAAVAARAVALVGLPLEDPAEPVFQDIFVLQCTALILIAAAVVWGSLRTRLQHRAVSRIASNLGDAPEPGSWRRRSGGPSATPRLRIAYWLPDSATYVESSGRQVAEPATEPGRMITTLVRGDQRVAVVSHVPGVSDIESAMGAALRLALDNERLQAEGLAQLEELRASRSPDRRDGRPGATAARARPPRRSPAAAPGRVLRDPARAFQRRVRRRRAHCCAPGRRRSKARRPRWTSSASWPRALPGHPRGGRSGCGARDPGRHSAPGGRHASG